MVGDGHMRSHLVDVEVVEYTDGVVKSINSTCASLEEDSGLSLIGPSKSYSFTKFQISETSALEGLC